MTLHRNIVFYDRATDRCHGIVAVSDEEFRTIRDLLGGDLSDPMYDAYPLRGEVLRKVFLMLRERLAVGEFEYFLETDADSVEQPAEGRS